MHNEDFDKITNEAQNISVQIHTTNKLSNGVTTEAAALKLAELAMTTGRLAEFTGDRIKNCSEALNYQSDTLRMHRRILKAVVGIKEGTEYEPAVEAFAEKIKRFERAADAIEKMQEEQAETKKYMEESAESLLKAPGTLTIKPLLKPKGIRMLPKTEEFVPNELQTMAVALPKRAMVYAHIRSGKTTAAAWDTYNYAINNPGRSAVLIATHRHDYAVEHICRMAKGRIALLKANVNGKFIIELDNGSTIMVMSHTILGPGFLSGAGLGCIVVDEPENLHGTAVYELERQAGRNDTMIHMYGSIQNDPRTHFRQFMKKTNRFAIVTYPIYANTSIDDKTFTEATFPITKTGDTHDALILCRVKPDEDTPETIAVLANVSSYLNELVKKSMLAARRSGDKELDDVCRNAIIALGKLKAIEDERNRNRRESSS